MINIYNKNDKTLDFIGVFFVCTLRGGKMSLVIGIVDKEKVVLASDSQVTIGGVRKISKKKDNYKIWHPDERKEILIGTVGSVREMNVTRYIENLVDEVTYLKDEVDMRYVSNKVVKKILKELKDANVINTKENVLNMNNSYLLASKNCLFQIFSDGAVMQIDNYTAIGSGSNEAIASLNNSEGKTPIERIKLAMDASSKNDIFVDYPLVISSTNILDFTVLEGSDHKNKRSDKI